MRNRESLMLIHVLEQLSTSVCRKAFQALHCDRAPQASTGPLPSPSHWLVPANRGWFGAGSSKIVPMLYRKSPIGLYSGGTYIIPLAGTRTTRRCIKRYRDNLLPEQLRMSNEDKDNPPPHRLARDQA